MTGKKIKRKYEDLECPKCKGKNYTVITGRRRWERYFKDGKWDSSVNYISRKIEFFCNNKGCSAEGEVIGKEVFT